MESAAKSNIKVLLDAQGGDEDFCESNVYYVDYLRYLIRGFKLKQIYSLFRKINRRSNLTKIELFKQYLYYTNDRKIGHYRLKR